MSSFAGPTEDRFSPEAKIWYGHWESNPNHRLQRPVNDSDLHIGKLKAGISLGLGISRVE
jgi:hypothetical protein